MKNKKYNELFDNSISIVTTNDLDELIVETVQHLVWNGCCIDNNVKTTCEFQSDVSTVFSRIKHSMVNNEGVSFILTKNAIDYLDNSYYLAFSIAAKTKKRYNEIKNILIDNLKIIITEKLFVRMIDSVTIKELKFFLFLNEIDENNMIYKEIAFNISKPKQFTIQQLLS